MMDAVVGAGPVLEAEERTYRKVTRRIVPLLFLCYLAAFLDRVNVGFAKLQMLHELNFSESAYGFGAGIFFLGYVLFEVPSNIVLHRVGARLWIARIMITWGLISGAMVFVASPLGFYALRFLLGVAEAGFIPGVLLYLTRWYPAERRGRITAIFLAAIPMAGIFGGPLSGWILSALTGVQGLSGWQWLFLIEAIPSLVLGVVVLVRLDDRVSQARWLDGDERRMLDANIAREDRDREGLSRLGAAFRTPRVWLLGLIYFGIVCGIYTLGFWLPTIIKQTGVADPLRIGLLTAIPYSVAIVAMVAWTSRADRRRERRWHTAIPCVVTAIGLVITARALHDTPVALAGLALVAAGSSSAQATFWSLPAAFLGGVAAAAGIALVNSLGNIAGFTGTYLVGWVRDATGSAATSLYVFAGLLVLSAVLVLTIPARLVNK